MKGFKGARSNARPSNTFESDQWNGNSTNVIRNSLDRCSLQPEAYDLREEEMNKGFLMAGVVLLFGLLSCLTLLAGSRYQGKAFWYLMGMLLVLFLLAVAGIIYLAA